MAVAFSLASTSATFDAEYSAYRDFTNSSSIFAGTVEKFSPTFFNKFLRDSLADAKIN